MTVYSFSYSFTPVEQQVIKQSIPVPVPTKSVTNRCSSFYMSLCASCFAALLVAVRLNYKFVTKSCVFTDHFNQSNFHFCDNTNGFIYFRYIILMPYIS